MNNHLDVIKAPVVTEKSSAISSNELKYVFKVDPKANKIQIKQAVESIFKVKVASVNTIMSHPKFKKVGKYGGMTNKYKKAVVTLKEGSKIEL